MSKGKKTILFVDDDLYIFTAFVSALEDAGYEVLKAETAKRAMDLVTARRGKIDVAIIDMVMYWDKPTKRIETEMFTGLSLAKRLKKINPSIKLIGHSSLDSVPVVAWFERFGAGYIRKPARPAQLVDRVHLALEKEIPRDPKIFIVHGQDKAALKLLVEFLKNDLKMKDINILRDQPNRGRAIIEKFEDAASEADLVFVLLTPDDVAYPKSSVKRSSFRARQNVIFELGYFYGYLRRSNGKVILLYRDGTEIPSDISGLVYIDITRGIRRAKKQILNELSPWVQPHAIRI